LSAAFTEPEPPKEDSSAPDNNDKEYEVITFEGLKDEPAATEQSADAPVIPALSKGISQIKRSIIVMSA